jgi:Uncharacterized conserved protein, contains double-stranded beta-helix domain
MPKLAADTVLTRHESGVCGSSSVQSLGDAGALTQFGVNLKTLAPGARSSIKHWHLNSDELIYVLAGEVTLHEGDRIETLQEGDVATFKAGVAAGHCLENRTDAPCSFLEIGTRAPTDTVTYPDDDRILTVEAEGQRFTWTTLDGAPASNLYSDDPA